MPTVGLWGSNWEKVSRLSSTESFACCFSFCVRKCYVGIVHIPV